MQSLRIGLGSGGWEGWGTWGEHVPEGRLFAIALVAFALCALWLAIAAWRHRRNLHAVPVRIHVAGTRGKSTTTRLIAAGLRAGGRQVVAKVTGSQPRLILPDGSEQDWPRRGPASVREQARFFARAARLRGDAAVVECMAIRPALVWASEAHLVQATTAVITNVRADHGEDIGEAPEAMAEAVRWAVPLAGRLIVTAEAATPALRAFAASRGTPVTVVHTAALDPFSADRALALAVCEAHGVPAAVAARAMGATHADPGSFLARALTIGGKSVRFANAFACNDVESLALLWRMIAHTAEASDPPVVLLNARRDRPLRTKCFLEFLAAQAPAALLFVAGDPLAVRLARRSGFTPGAVRRLRARTGAAALAELAGPAPAGGMIWGIGNHQGLGASLVAELAGQSSTC
jgi:poly-gamma-glutamate synthase PgsB/CapB